MLPPHGKWSWHRAASGPALRSWKKARLGVEGECPAGPWARREPVASGAREPQRRQLGLCLPEGGWGEGHKPCLTLMRKKKDCRAGAAGLKRDTLGKGPGRESPELRATHCLVAPPGPRLSTDQRALVYSALGLCLGAVLCCFLLAMVCFLKRRADQASHQCSPGLCPTQAAYSQGEHERVFASPACGKVCSHPVWALPASGPRA